MRSGVASPERRVVLVVPCYNEASRFDADAFANALVSTTDLAFVLVDDGSTDDTRSVLARFASRFPGRCELLPLTPNGGKAEAVRHGLRHALRDPVTYVGYWDADLATPLDAVADLAAFLDLNAACDGVLGSRVLLLGRRIERRVWRHYVGRVFATAASLTLGLPIYDTQCGAKLFRASGFLADALELPFLARWAFDVELIARLHRDRREKGERSTLCEFPLAAWRDVPGSKVGPLGALRAALDLVRIAWRHRRRRHRGLLEWEAPVDSRLPGRAPSGGSA
jgi:dolichyl-phosphate beta-glucosyltransferase